MNYGIIAPSSHNVQAGYDTVNSVHYFTIPGSFSYHATGNNSSFRLGSNVNVPGRWAFRIDHGPPLNEDTGPFYPIAGNTSSRSLHGSSPQILLQQPFVYFGQSYNHIYVNHNGHLTFSAPWYNYIPQRFPMYGSRDVIAPFWTDFDNRVNGQVYYNQYTSGSVLQQATQDINEYFPGFNFSATWVFVATWYEMAYYPMTGTRTTIQAVLISGGQYSFVLMNYGIIAPSSHHVQAGYDTVNSVHYFTIPGSFSYNATGNNSSFRLGSNVNVPGRWGFLINHGPPLNEDTGKSENKSVLVF
uniref:NIDO domain-containing protein n=1 Tax=Dicentrarchus labrax TaxID=13489 RepID=A0A8C4GSK2_DICLA